MLTDDQKDAYYKDLVCNSYCPIEVPAAVRELRKHRQVSFVEGMREVMTQRILAEAVRGGEGKYPMAHVQEMLEDINRPKSKLGARLKQRLYIDLEVRANQREKVRVISVETPTYHALVRTSKRLNIPLVKLTTVILQDWLDNVIKEDK